MKEGYEKYCRFYRCEEKECWYNGCKCEGERLIIKEPKQETLEEADKRFNIFEKGILKPNRFDFICGFRDGAKFGAKWQQETLEEDFKIWDDLFGILAWKFKPTKSGDMYLDGEKVYEELKSKFKLKRI